MYLNIPTGSPSMCSGDCSSNRNLLVSWLTIWSHKKHLRCKMSLDSFNQILINLLHTHTCRIEVLAFCHIKNIMWLENRSLPCSPSPLPQIGCYPLTFWQFPQTTCRLSYLLTWMKKRAGGTMTDKCLYQEQRRERYGKERGKWKKQGHFWTSCLPTHSTQNNTGMVVMTEAGLSNNSVLPRLYSLL